MNIVLTGGKTGGHIIPLVRLSKRIDLYEYYYVGFNDFLEEEICNKEKIKFLGLDMPGHKISIFFKIKNWFNVINNYFKNIKIDLIISSGGLHSFPLLLYARIKKIKYILIEENSRWGLVNQLFKTKAVKIFYNFPLEKRKNSLLALNPSAFITPINRQIIYDFIIIGGSLGSKILADIAIKISKKSNVLLIAGRYESVYKKEESKNLTVVGFQDMKKIITKGKIIITRAGSSTIFELLSAHAKFIIIPSLKTKKNHQYYNAKYFFENNLALMLNEKDLKSTDFTKYLAYDFNNILLHQKDYLKSYNGAIYESTIKEIIN